MDFILASASPRRRELLQQIGARFQVRPVDLDESIKSGETPEHYVVRLAQEKAEAGARLFSGCPVMGADTTVVADGRILGKPRDENDAIAMLSALSGKTHRVLSAVAMSFRDNIVWRMSETRVKFRELTEAECRCYWQTGEPRDKAGAYAIQGKGAVFVEHLEGSYSGVVGLPLLETQALLQHFGLSIWQPTDGDMTS